MPAPRRKPLTVTDQVPADDFSDLKNDTRAIYDPNDPTLNEPLLQNQNPLALASRRMEEDREMQNFARDAAKLDVEENTLQRLTDEFPPDELEGAKVKIWRYPAGGGKLEWVVDTNMIEWQVQGQPWIARTFGAGRYQIMMYRGGGRGLYARPECPISREGAEYAKKQWAKEHSEENAPAVAPASVGGQGTERLAQVMIQGFTQLGELIARQNQSGGGEEQFLKKLSMYKELFAPATPVPVERDAGAGSTLDLAVKIAGLIHPGSAEKTTLETFAEIFKDFAPGIIEAVRAAAPAPAHPQQRALAGPQPGRVDNPQGSQGNLNVNMIQNAVIKAQLKNLVSKAQKDSDPALYAEVIFDNLDNIPAEFAQRFLNDPNWLEWLAGFNPHVLQYRDWFVELYAELRRVIEEEAAKQGPGPNLTNGANGAINAGNIILAGGAGVSDDTGGEAGPD